MLALPYSNCESCQMMQHLRFSFPQLSNCQQSVEFSMWVPESGSMWLKKNSFTHQLCDCRKVFNFFEFVSPIKQEGLGIIT